MINIFLPDPREAASNEDGSVREGAGHGEPPDGVVVMVVRLLFSPTLANAGAAHLATSPNPWLIVASGRVARVNRPAVSRVYAVSYCAAPSVRVFPTMWPDRGRVTASVRVVPSANAYDVVIVAPGASRSMPVSAVPFPAPLAG